MTANSRAYNATWYVVHRDEHRARVAAGAARKRRELAAYARAYRRTAAGMLTSARHHAKGRKVV